MLGLPEEREADLIEAARFYSKLRCCALIETFYLTYYPSTQIIGIAKERNLLSEEDERDIINGNIKNYFDGNTIKNKKTLRTAKNYSLFFEMIPLLNAWMVNAIIKLRGQNYLYIFGFPLKVIGRLLIIAKFRDVRMIEYVSNYVKYIIMDTPRAFIHALLSLTRISKNRQRKP